MVPVMFERVLQPDISVWVKKFGEEEGWACQCLSFLSVGDQI